jgi:hypothetical protein
MIETIKVSYGEKVRDLEMISFMEVPPERQQVDLASGTAQQGLENYFKHATLLMHNCLVNPIRWREVEKLTSDEFAEFYSHWILASIVNDRMLKIQKQKREEKSMSFLNKLRLFFGLTPKFKTLPAPPTPVVVEKPEVKKDPPAVTEKVAPATVTVKKPAPRKVALKLDAKDGDGDGLVQDGTIHERKVAPKKKPAVKKAPPKE